MPSDFDGAFSALRDILKRHADGMLVQLDGPTCFTIITRAIGPNRQPLWFGSVQTKKSAVTYHLMPLYFNPTLQQSVPPELLRRKQGKTCFNFQRPDADLFSKLDELTRLAREHWEQHGFLEPGPIPQERMEAALRAGGEDPDRIARIRRAKGRRAAVKRAAAAGGKNPKPKYKAKKPLTKKRARSPRS